MDNNYIDSSESYQEYIIKMQKQMEDTFRPDSVVLSIIDKFMDRARKGKRKYGVDLDRTDLSLLEWIEHAQQEHMDAILYLEKIKQVTLKEEDGEEKIF